MRRAALCIAFVACAPPPASEPALARVDPEETFGPLTVGRDYLSYRKFTPQPFLSRAHGNRWVDVYVSAVGAEVYETGAEVPVGTIVVKTSWVDEGGAPSQVAGPIFVMEKRAPGYFPEHGDWYYAIHWEKPTGSFAKGGPIYWQGKSPRVAYCYDGCHDNYERGLGGLLPSSLLPR